MRKMAKWMYKFQAKNMHQVKETTCHTDQMGDDAVESVGVVADTKSDTLVDDVVVDDVAEESAEELVVDDTVVEDDGVEEMSVSEEMLDVEAVSVEEVADDSELSEEEIEELLFMYEEEKLAKDVYEVLGELYDLRIFDNIARSEETHEDSVASLMEKYDVDFSDLAELEEGEFANEELQDLYEALVEQGSVSLEDALEVGIIIEETDIEDLLEYLGTDVHEEIATVFEHLESGSEHHLAAFEALLG